VVPDSRASRPVDRPDPFSRSPLRLSRLAAAALRFCVDLCDHDWRRLLIIARKCIRNPLSGRAAFTRAANCGNGVGSLVRFSRQIIVVSLVGVRKVKSRGINQFAEY